MKKEKLLAFLGLAAGIVSVCGLTTFAAAGVKEISTVELTETEYNGTVYTYALQKQYETDSPDEKLVFDELKGLKLQDVTYETLETIYQTETLKESKDYKNLLVKDESKIAKAINVDGETYNLDTITWSEEPNIEEVSYTVDYGYCTKAPTPADTYEYTYTSPVFNTDNTVTLPFVRMEQSEAAWVDGFSATITFKNLDGEVFKLGSHEFSYNPDKLSLTESDFTELVKLLGYDTSKYRLTSASWSGKAYKGKNGELYRDAKASGQQYAASYKAIYEDDIENGKMYTAHATYTCEVELAAAEADPTYIMQATAYYQKTELPLLLSAGIVILVILAIGILYVISKKKSGGTNADVN